MNEAEIRKYAGLMQELGLTGFEITENDCTMRLERAAVAAAPAIVAAVPAVAPAPAVSQAADTADYISIKSPIVGVFYAASAENADPYVSIGDRVEKGATLCIIEAMKLMNEICAEESGIISEICVKNGQVVEYGTELFRIKR